MTKGLGRGKGENAIQRCLDGKGIEGAVPEGETDKRSREMQGTNSLCYSAQKAIGGERHPISLFSLAKIRGITRAFEWGTFPEHRALPTDDSRAKGNGVALSLYSKQ